MSTTLSVLSPRTVFFPVLLAALAAARPAPAGTLRIGTLDASSHGPAAVATGFLTGDLRDSLDGHIGELGFDGYELLEAPALTEEFLSGVDIVILHNVYDNHNPMSPPLSEEEQGALLERVLAGAGALVIADGAWPAQPAAAEALVAPFSMSIEGTIPDADVSSVGDPAAHPVTGGRFGEVTYIKTFYAGWLTDLGPHAAALATLAANGEPSLAVIEEGALGAGSGRVVLLSDADPLGDADVLPGQLTFPEHEALFLNTVAWLSEGREGTPACDTHCLGIEISEIDDAGNNTRVTAQAIDDGDDLVLYTFTARRGVSYSKTMGPQAERSADFGLPWGQECTIIVTVSDGSNCVPEAADASCQRSYRVPPEPPAGRQQPGDCNQDRKLDISDAVCVLGFLFLGAPEQLPCGDGSATGAGNVSLADWQLDGKVDLSDAVGLLQFLFSGGPPHPLGSECAGIAECPEACGG
ncbi:MAG: hypothetical protein HY721_05020 [Planctomycetes bacterium]|nr:hypothetical protein [Planctomycetota bacterium]